MKKLLLAILTLGLVASSMQADTYYNTGDSCPSCVAADVVTITSGDYIPYGGYYNGGCCRNFSHWGR